jgi:flagellar motility protein MotE (MotC chaperone)
VKDIVARLEALNAHGELALEQFPSVSGLLVDIEKREIFIPWPRIASLAPDGARLNGSSINMQSFARREGEVLLARDMLDKQLIDIDGRRVIRANDLQLYAADGTVRLMAVDVSGEALLRRLSWGRLFTGMKVSSDPPRDDGGERLRRRRVAPAKLITWADIEPLRAGVPDVRLRLQHKRLALLHPVDLAHIADELSYKQGAEIIESLDDERAADTLQEMDEERQADIVEGMDQERAADILEEMDPDDAADLLGELDDEQAEDLLRRMDRDDAEDVEELLHYPEESAGGIMTSDFLTVPPHVSADDAIAFIRGMQDAPDVIDYLYVIEGDEGDSGIAWMQPGKDEKGRLLGVVSLRDLLLAPGTTSMQELMDTDFLWARVDEPCEAASRRLTEYNLIAMPVLDEREFMVGLITIDDAMEVLLPERWLKRVPHVFR